MNKRILSALTAVGLVAGGLFAGSVAEAQETPVVPEVVQIDDPVGDANGLNDQDNAYGTPLAGEGDHTGPAGGTATDIRKVWFSHTATDVSLNIQLNGNPGNLAYDTYFRFSSNVGEGSVASDTTRGCLQWVASVNGAAGAYTGPTEGALTDKCNVGTPVSGPLTITDMGDGTFALTATFPRDSSPLLADGQTLTAPFGVSRILYVAAPSPVGVATAVTLDNTKRGTDYLITGGDVVTTKPDKPKPPGKNNPPGKGKKKGCGKGKGKKKGACPTPEPPGLACAAFEPGESGVDQPLITVTDEATEEKPVEEVVALENSTADFAGDASIVNLNVVVDSASPSNGLYAYIEFPTRRDFDLNLLHTDGSYAARSHGFNTIIPEARPTGRTNESGHGGESTDHSEKLVGIKTDDCGGWTLAVENWLGEGDDYTVKLWLGETKNDPLASGEEVP